MVLQSLMLVTALNPVSNLRTLTFSLQVKFKCTDVKILFLQDSVARCCSEQRANRACVFDIVDILIFGRKSGTTKLQHVLRKLTKKGPH